MTWLAGVLLMLLQRTPVLKVLVHAEFSAGGRMGQVLGLAVPAAAAAAAGTVHAQTGATTWTTSPGTPATAKVGKLFTMAFALTGAARPTGSYGIDDPLPPGLSLEGATLAGGQLTLNETTGVISGRPTQTGTWLFELRAWEKPNRRGDEARSLGVLITVTEDLTVPSFQSHPADLTADYGSTVVFSVSVAGTPQPILQWRKDGVAIPGATATTLDLVRVTLADAGEYDCVATNSAGSTASNLASLTVDPPAVATIVTQPGPMVSREGAGAFFSVAATGVDTTYQWFHDNAPVSGAMGPSVFLPSVSDADAGSYSVRIENPGGVVESAIARLSVVATGAARLINLSTRALVGVDGGVVIPGFALGGAGRKSILIRAVGPKLVEFGVDAAIADPVLRLFSGAVEIAANDDWGQFANPTSMEAASERVGAFSLVPSVRDSSLLVDVPVGSYTAQIVGADGGGGISLIELYDADGASAEARLLNISTRARVGTGEDFLIPGFVVDGDVSQTLLIRAVGPALVGFGVEDALEDPVMSLFRSVSEPGPESILVAANDDWEDNGDVAMINTVAEAAGAFALESGSADSAMLVALNPGAYTVQVSGKSGGTGIALVEVYLVGP